MSERVSSVFIYPGITDNIIKRILGIVHTGNIKALYMYKYRLDNEPNWDLTLTINGQWMK